MKVLSLSLSHLSQLKGVSFGEKTNFRKVSQCRKTERGDPLGFLNTHSVLKYQKIGSGKTFYFRKKIAQCRKKTKMGFFNIHSVAKQEKIEGGPFGEKNPKKSLAVPKKLKGPFGLARYGMLRGKTGKTFLVQIARANGAIIYFVELLRTILVSSCGLKKKKSHYNSRVSLHKAPTKNED